MIKTLIRQFLFLLFILLFSVTAMANTLPDTGQTKCYDNYNEITCPKPGELFYGQDANYTINPPSYTKLDAESKDLPIEANEWVMIRDNVTGLIWEVKQSKNNISDYTNLNDADNTYTWNDAQYTFIPGLNNQNFGGYSDWRMPTIKELASIVSYGSNFPSINKDYFKNTVSLEYWASERYVFDSGNAWRIRFRYGNIGNSHISKNKYYVRAVRGGPAVELENLVINDDGTVTDSNTGLMWQQVAPDNAMTRANALSYCENLSLSGYEDWRLPNMKELQSIVDYSKYNPAVNIIAFPHNYYTYFWSSTNSNGFITGGYLLMDFGSGLGQSSNLRSDTYYVRAVRGGQAMEPSDKNRSDINCDGRINLTDAILSLKIASGMNPSSTCADFASLGIDIDDDGKISILEAIYALQKLAEQR